jgi:predicted RNase H-like HicB family nuclease
VPADREFLVDQYPYPLAPGCGRFVVTGRRGATASRDLNNEGGARLPEAVGGSGTVSVVSEPLRLTIVYEDAGDGWVLARIPQVRGVISQGQTRDEARDNVIDALREVLAVRFGTPPGVQETTDSESVELTIAA